ncbi:MAG: ATP-binding protein [Balneolaceae bacterium]|nr:ATP-binding protein [Balneolaceae bacterium]
MSEKQTKTLTLPSSFDEIQKVESFVRDLQDWIGFSEELYENVKLALSEAVTNAIVHGNQEDKAKKVYITAYREDDLLQISIKDEGDGFDPGTLPDPLKEENLLNVGGRGVFLIEQFSDDATYSENGTKLTMRFSLKK